jgi:hypothetical protein
MRRALSKSFLGLIVFTTLLTSILAIPAQAQSTTLTPTPKLLPVQTNTPVSVATPTPTTVQFTNPDVVTFAQLRENDANNITLTGPYDTEDIGIILPADWALKAGTQLDLQFGVSFNTDVQFQSDVVVIGGGTLTVFLNNKLLSTIQLSELGEVQTAINIPLAAFDTVSKDGVNVLSFVLESFESCRFYGQNTTLYIHPTSFLTLPHEIVRPSTNLVNFPRPIFQNSFVSDSALLIVPDQPSPAELQAAMITASGLGKLSSNKLILDITTISNLKNADVGNNHLIFVGKAASLPTLDGLDLPYPVRSGQFQISDVDKDNGLVEMILSPWSNSHVVLVISANTDQGIVKAAQAISTGVIRPNRSDNFAAIEQVSLDSISSPQAVDRTLSDLGYTNRTLSSRGFNAGYYEFNIPVGMGVSPESYFELVYGHSALLDYDSSQIVILLNNQPIGSVRMSDATASQPINKEKIMIPPSIVNSGNNYLAIQVYLVPVDECVPTDIKGLWVNIWPESTLHIPQVVAPANPFSIEKLADFPVPFTYDPILSNTAFVLDRNDLETWRNAVQIASFLGSRSSGQVIALSTFYGDELPATERSNYNLLVVGRPSQIPFISEINDYLPAPFTTGNDNASEGNNFQVTYQIFPDSPLGYLEIIQSPWNPSNTILAVLGNTAQGVNWAASALLDDMRWQLAGNFAVINDQQVLTADTVSNYVTVDNNSVPVPNFSVAPTSVNLDVTPVNQQVWIIPALIVTIILIFLVLAIVIIRNWSRSRTRRKIEKES